MMTFICLIQMMLLIYSTIASASVNTNYQAAISKFPHKHTHATKKASTWTLIVIAFLARSLFDLCRKVSMQTSTQTSSRVY